MYYLNKYEEYVKEKQFLRTKFICIIWTNTTHCVNLVCSWGLSLFVLFEPFFNIIIKCIGSWGLSLFGLFERPRPSTTRNKVLEDWIYLYYLNFQLWRSINWFYYMCTFWSFRMVMLFLVISWLSLFLVNFVLFSWLPYTK